MTFPADSALPVPAVHVSVQPLTPSGPVLALLQEASSDRELVHNTYLPADLSEPDARAWVQAHAGRTWVVLVDDVPAGVLHVDDQPDAGQMTVPEGSWETETWLLSRYRGRGVASTAWALVRGELVGTLGIRNLVSVVWEDNQASLRRLARDGYQDLGRTWWGPAQDTTDDVTDGGQDQGGWCRVLLLPLSH